MSNPVSKAKGFIKQIPAHWSTPPEGKHISYSEFSAYSFGGIGVNTINSIFGYVGLTASCLLVGSAYGIDPVHLAWMSTLVTVINLIKTPFVSMLIDNTNTKYGKFRPYLILTGIPTALLICLMAFIPNDINYTLKCVLLCTIYTFAMIFQSIYALAFTSLAQVLTPDSDERTSLLSVSQFVYSLGPSIVNIILPVLAGLFAGGMRGFTAYRVLFPIFSVIGIALSVWTFKGTKEKIVVSKDYVAKVKFSEGIKSLYGNRYFWLFYLYNILGSLYLATLAIGGDGVICASITADIFDYQQWKTGQRLEGFITQFGGMIVSGVGLVTGLILPYFYRFYGLHNDYDVLFDEAVRTPIFNVMIITTVISCLLAIVPVLFYNLNSKTLEKIACDLEERKAISDGKTAE